MSIAMKPVCKEVALSTGVTLQYVEQGDPTGLPVIFLHGIGDSWRSWERVQPDLPERIHAIAVTQRGHGDATRPATGYGFDDFAADLEAFIDAHGLESVVLVGHSMGSYIAQRFAMNHPERVLGLVLIGSVTTWRGNQAVAALWDVAISAFTDPIDPDFAHDFVWNPLISPGVYEVMVRECLKVPAHVWRAGWQSIMVSDYSPNLASIQAPTLIVWGDQDGMCPRSEQEALVAAISRARLVVYASADHNTHWEDPERFAADLVAFTQSLTG